MDSGDGPAIHFFCGRGFWGCGGGCSLVGGRGQAQGLPLRERLRGKGETARVVGARAGARPASAGIWWGWRGVGWRSSFGWARVQYRHQVRRGMLLAGGVAGAEPPHKGGPNRPDRPNARREWRGERREKTCARLTRGRELTVAVPMGGVWGSGGRIGGGCGGGSVFDRGGEGCYSCREVASLSCPPDLTSAKV